MSTKESILRVLEQNKGDVLSGQELASRLNISRAAVWKAIQALRREGHRIDAATNRGYRLSPDSNVLSAEGISLHVKNASAAALIHVFQSLESTNLTAKKMALDGAPAGTVVVTETQTGGRGRMGRSFFSPAGGGIYISFVLKPPLAAAKSVLITTAASVAVCKAIENVTGIACRIKWVNDVYKGEKKICGILTEAVTDFESGNIDYIVLGIGINYSTPQSAFPPELDAVAGSLFGETSTGQTPERAAVTRSKLIAAVIDQVLEVSGKLETRDFIREYKARSFILGEDILILPTGGPNPSRGLAEGIPATAVDIDEDGGLVVRCADGVLQTLKSGEISIRRQPRADR
jgi:BirA family biotin operon repressor/biotin-[acetyl-CoA-carboxylase] ligase